MTGLPRLLAHATVAIAAPLVTQPSQGETGPAAGSDNRSCMIVPFAAGGGNDIFARLVGNKAAEFLGQQFVI
jgi:tripartite-type tricarboxylate transporter receptor subunit TctC